MAHALTDKSYPHTLCGLHMTDNICYLWGKIELQNIDCPDCKKAFLEEQAEAQHGGEAD